MEIVCWAGMFRATMPRDLAGRAGYRVPAVSIEDHQEAYPCNHRRLLNSIGQAWEGCPRSFGLVVDRNRLAGGARHTNAFRRKLMRLKKWGLLWSLIAALCTMTDAGFAQETASATSAAASTT